MSLRICSDLIQTCKPFGAPVRAIYQLSWQGRAPRVIHYRFSSTFSTAPRPALTVNPYTPSNDCEYQAHVPPDLEIDRSRSLSNTVPQYNQHIVISTGKSDWESRIENEAGGNNMAKVLKEMTKRKEEQHDVCRGILPDRSCTMA